MPRKLTLAEFIEKAKQVHKSKYRYDEVEYVNSWTKVTITCPAHGNFSQSPNRHTMGDGCPECRKIAIGNAHRKPKETFIAESVKAHGSRYDYSLVDYKNQYITVKIKCSLHGIFEQLPKVHALGGGCPRCSYIQRGEAKRLSQDEFIKLTYQTHKDKYDYSLVKYEGMEKKIRIICPHHGIFEQRAGEHLRYGCNECGNQAGADAIRITRDEFIERSRTVHKNRYDYSLVKFRITAEKVTIICPEHGIFEQIAGSHLYAGQGCPVCKSSKGETKIHDFLKSLDIDFERQKTFPDCKRRWKLRFDFYFRLNGIEFLIEYDGQQHFDGWDGKADTLKYIQHHDSLKTAYAASNGFHLIRIPYTQFDNIETILKTEIRKHT